MDPNLLTFDIVMETKFGTSYNSYFIDAEKKTVIDTVKEAFWPEYKEKLLSLTDPSDIEYIVCNHTEPDHSGSLAHLLELAPNATVVGSGEALTYLAEMFGLKFKSLRVKDGDVVDLGNMKLNVIGAPNLHWPDSIYTYLQEEKILFSDHVDQNHDTTYDRIQDHGHYIVPIKSNEKTIGVLTSCGRCIDRCCHWCQNDRGSPNSG